MRRSYDVSDARVIYVEATERSCEACHANLWIRWHEPKFVHRLDGVYHLNRQIKKCPVDGCAGAARAYRPPEDVRFALPRATYGTDVVIEIGERYLRGGTSLREISADLNERGVPVDQRHVGRLFRAYVALTKLARGGDERLRQRLLAQGGILLMADGVQYDNTSPVLYLVWDALSGEPLFGERKTFKGKDDLVPLLERVKALEVPIRGIVSDKEKGLLPAIVEVFPGVPHQLCQTHFLKNCAAGMSSSLTSLGASINRRAEKVQRIASRLHERGVNSVEWETDSARAAEPEAVENPSTKTTLPATSVVGGDAVDASTAALSEEQLAAELCAMARHASRATGRAPLNPPEHVRHQRLEEVRAVVQDATRKKGAHTQSSSASTRH